MTKHFEQLLLSVVLGFMLVGLIAPAMANSRYAHQDVGCFVLVKFKWNSQSVSGGELSGEMKRASLTRFIDGITNVLNDMYYNGGRNEENIPFLGNTIEDDYAIFFMKPECETSRAAVREILRRYVRSIPQHDLRGTPSFIVSNERISKYQAVCGLAATADTCPDADKRYSTKQP